MRKLEVILLGSLPPSRLTAAKTLADCTLAMMSGFDQDRARRLCWRVLALWPELQPEFEAASELLGFTVVDTVKFNLCYDLLLASLGCSTMALATADGPVLARNMDWFPPERIAEASMIVDTHYGMSVGFPGLVGAVTGISRNGGFAVALNALPDAAHDWDGVPTLLLTRMLLEAVDFGEAVRLATTEQVMSACLLTLVGHDNTERICVERHAAAQDDAILRRPPDGAPLVVTNNAEATRCECPRWQRLHELCAGQEPGPADFDALLGWLDDPGVRQPLTAQHILAWPKRDLLSAYVPDFS